MLIKWGFEMIITCEKCKEVGDAYKRNKHLCKKCVIRKTIERKRLFKKMSIDYKGGKCESCGYNKCARAMEFHHLDPSFKDYAISNLIGKWYDWEMIKKELDKCVLLCSNCHKEEHNKNDGIFLFSEKELTVGGTRNIGRRRGTINYVDKTCAHCGKKFSVSIKRRGCKFCSLLCSSLFHRTVARPSKENLQEMINNMSYVKIGRQFGVSDVAIKSWCNNYGIKRTVELRNKNINLVLQMHRDGKSMVRISKEVGLNRSTVSTWIKKFNASSANFN